MERNSDKTSRWKEIVKIKAEINEIETQLYKESMKPKVGL
jgi:hypothetical protein